MVFLPSVSDTVGWAFRKAIGVRRGVAPKPILSIGDCGLSFQKIFWNTTFKSVYYGAFDRYQKLSARWWMAEYIWRGKEGEGREEQPKDFSLFLCESHGWIWSPNGGRDKSNDEALVWLSVWMKVKMFYMWTGSYLASLKPEWFNLSQFNTKYSIILYNTRLTWKTQCLPIGI